MSEMGGTFVVLSGEGHAKLRVVLELHWNQSSSSKTASSAPDGGASGYASSFPFAAVQGHLNRTEIQGNTTRVVLYGVQRLGAARGTSHDDPNTTVHDLPSALAVAEIWIDQKRGSCRD